jgi:predicted enzyme related to lactoylglutathione lyase
MDMGGGNQYSMYGKGQPFGGMFNRHGDMANMHPFWLVYIYVKDVKKAVDVATKNGAFVQRPPMEVPGGGTIAILGDPQGAAFAVHSSRAEAGGGARGAGKKRAGAKKAASKKKSTAKKGTAMKKRPATKKRSASKKRSPTKKRSATKTRSAAKKRSATKKRSGTKKTTRRRR